MVARSGLPVTRRADLRVPWSPQPGWPRSALARVARPVRAVMRWISQPAGLLEEVWRTLRTACGRPLRRRDHGLLARLHRRVRGRAGTPVQLPCLMQPMGTRKRAWAALGRIAGRTAPAVVSGRPLANVLERVQRGDHRCSCHGDDDQEGADEHPPFHVQPEAGRRHADGRNDQDECDHSTDEQGPEDSRLHDSSYTIVGSIHENGNLQQ